MMGPATLVIWSVFLTVVISGFFVGLGIAFARYIDRRFGQ